MGVPKHHTAANAAWKRRADFCNSNDNTKACQDPEPRASHSIFPLCLVTRGQILFIAEVGLFSRGFRRAWGWVSARGAVSGRAGRSPEPSLLPGLSGGSTRISLCTIRPRAQAVFSTGHFPSTVTLCVTVSVSLARAQPSVGGWGDLHDTTGLCTVIQRLLINVGGMMGLALECQEKKGSWVKLKCTEIFILMLETEHCSDYSSDFTAPTPFGPSWTEQAEIWLGWLTHVIKV